MVHFIPPVSREMIRRTHGCWTSLEGNGKTGLLLHVRRGEDLDAMKPSDLLWLTQRRHGAMALYSLSPEGFREIPVSALGLSVDTARVHEVLHHVWDNHRGPGGTFFMPVILYTEPYPAEGFGPVDDTVISTTSGG